MNKARFQTIASQYPRLRIGIVGDYSLDRYLEIDPGKAETSIETGLPVRNVTHVRGQPGAAGTILNNLVALGAKAIYPIGFCGKDGEGYELQHALRAHGKQVLLEHFIPTEHRRTFTYCKPLLMHPGKPPEELSRLDTKNWTPTPTAVEDQLIDSLRQVARSVEVLIVLDQVDLPNTGVVTERILKELGNLAEEDSDLLILADSRRGLARWPKLTFKMNVNELFAMTGSPGSLSPAAIESLARRVARENGRSVFITMADHGMMGAAPDGQIEQVTSVPVRGPIDVVGAGDAVTANLAMALAAGSELRESLELANSAASIVIHQLGTTGTASVSQMEELLFGSMWIA